MRTLTVQLADRSYPIYIGEKLLNQLGKLLELSVKKNSKLFIITDNHVAKLYLNQVEEELKISGYKSVSYCVPAGEGSKSLKILEDLVGFALQSGLDRHTVVLALGGGVVGDLAGFFAASYMRGIPFIQIPTTLLAHDSSVGGKVAVNHALSKNTIGAFHQPLMVIFDTMLLHSLPKREVSAGFAEVIKHALIWDRDFYYWIKSHAQALFQLQEPFLTEAIYRGCAVKAEIVSQDEKEQHLRAILNLGHTTGHALEALTGYEELIHGEAIAIGMVVAAQIAEHLNLIEVTPHNKSLAEEYCEIFNEFALPIALPNHLEISQIIEVMKRDKKNRDDVLVFILPKAVGKVEIVKDVPISVIHEILNKAKATTPTS